MGILLMILRVWGGVIEKDTGQFIHIEKEKVFKKVNFIKMQGDGILK